MWRILQHNQAEYFVIAAGRMHSPSKFVDRVFAVLGPAAQNHVDADGILLRPLDALQRLCNDKKSTSLCRISRLCRP